MNASLSIDFVMSYPYSVFTELNMMVVRLTGATTLPDSQCSDLLGQWMSLSHLLRTLFTEARDHAPLPARPPCGKVVGQLGQPGRPRHPERCCRECPLGEEESGRDPLSH